MRLILTISILCLMFSFAIASDNAITTADEAIAKANQYFGTSDIEGYSITENVSTEMILIQDDKTPYLNRWINNNKIWRIRYIDIPYYKAFYNLPTIMEEMYITFDILIDFETGRLLKIGARVKDTAFVVERPDIKAKDDIKYDSLYAGLPNDIQFSFLDIAKHIPLNIAGSVEFEAVYVLKIINDSTSVPRWNITAYGHPYSVSPGPVKMKSGAIVKVAPKTVLSTCQAVIDGLTGRAIGERKCPGQ